MIKSHFVQGFEEICLSMHAKCNYKLYNYRIMHARGMKYARLHFCIALLKKIKRYSYSITNSLVAVTTYGSFVCDRRNYGRVEVRHNSHATCVSITASGLTGVVSLHFEYWWGIRIFWCVWEHENFRLHFVLSWLILMLIYRSFSNICWWYKLDLFLLKIVEWTLIFWAVVRWMTCGRSYSNILGVPVFVWIVWLSDIWPDTLFT